MEKNQKPQENQTPEDNSSVIEKAVNHLAVGGKYSSEKKNMTRLFLYSLSVNGLLGVVLIFFAISFASVMNNRDVSVVIPPGTHDDLSLSFGTTRVNRPVFEIYSDYLARGFGNFNYSNVDNVFANLIEYSDGSVRHQMHSILSQKAKIVKENFVTQTFRLQRVEIDRDSRGTLARCFGYATRKVGKKTQFDELPYLITFWFKSYRGNVTIIGMSTDVNRQPAAVGEKLRIDHYEQDNRYINF